jgi:hypothetical protein
VGPEGSGGVGQNQPDQLVSGEPPLSITQFLLHSKQQMRKLIADDRPQRFLVYSEMAMGNNVTQTS